MRVIIFNFQIRGFSSVYGLHIPLRLSNWAKFEGMYKHIE